MLSVWVGLLVVVVFEFCCVFWWEVTVLNGFEGTP